MHRAASAKTPSDKFRDATCALERDGDPEHFRERVAKLGKYEPVERSE